MTTQQEPDGIAISKVAGGKHRVPQGVAVEELDGGKRKLSDVCPAALLKLLEMKDLTLVYKDMVDDIVNEGKTRDVFGRWHDVEFNTILDRYRDDYARKGVYVALCKRSSGSGVYRWLEYIDNDVASDYVPQYDTANYSGQTIKTVYTTLNFPKGVAVEEFRRFKFERLRTNIPTEVQDLLSGKNLMDEYKNLIDAFVTRGVGKGTFSDWKIEQLKQIKDEYEPLFKVKGVSLYVSKKEEYISHGASGGHMEYFRWIEFVDDEAQPNYKPQRDADVKDGGDACIVS